VDTAVSIHNPLTVLPCFGKPPKVGSSDYTTNSIWLSEQQAAQMCNFRRKHQRYLAAVQYKIREQHFFITITTQNTLIKWKSDF